MNRNLNEPLREMIIHHILTEKERLFYKKVLNTEDNIAEQASTAEQFIKSLQSTHLYDHIAREYSLTVPKVLEVLSDIEERIGRRMQEMQGETEWFDCTNMIQSDGTSKLFYLEDIGH